MSNRDLSRFGQRGALPLSEAMNQLLRDAVTGPGGLAGAGALAALGAGMNLYETGEAYILQVPLPGARADQLRITARENVVALQGTTVFAVPEGARALYVGTGGGPFREQIQLPGDVDADAAQADYAEGVLTLTLPKAAAARARTIRVTQARGQGQPRIEGQGSAAEAGEGPAS